MARESIIKPMLVVFAAAVVLYFVAYAAIEHLRTRKGAWQITFATDGNGVPSLSVSEPQLHLQNVRIRFPRERLSTSNRSDVVVFTASATNVPFGKVIYFDTTFLPGAVVFDMFGHQVQLLPRTLMIDHRELPWQTETTTDVVVAPTNRPASHL